MFVINVKIYQTFSFIVFQNTFLFRRFWTLLTEIKSVFYNQRSTSFIMVDGLARKTSEQVVDITKKHLGYWRLQ